MELNTGAEDTGRLLELWRTYKTGSIGVAGDADRLIKFVEEILVDTERKNAVLGNLKTSLTKVQQKFAGAKRIRTALTAEFPEAIPEGP